MKNIDLTVERRKALEFTPIEIPYVDEEQLYVVQECAMQALEKYKAMYELLRAADSLSDDIPLGTWFSDFMSEECSVPRYEDSAVDVIEGLRKHLKIQIARFEQFIDALDDEIDCCVEQRMDDGLLRWTCRNPVL